MFFRTCTFEGFIAALSFVMALSGCGGGGGGVRPSTPAPAPTPPPSCMNIDTVAHGCISRDEFERLRDGFAAVRLADPEFRGSSTDPDRFVGQWALETLNVHQAHAALAVKEGDRDGKNVKPGDGVIVGVMDTGVDLTHHELDGASVTETFLQNLPDETRTDFDADGFSHGTAVTSIMAAQPNDAGFLGIAWGATFRVFTVPIDAPAPVNDDDPGTFDWESAYKDVLASGMNIVNASYSAVGTFIENYDANGLRNYSRFGSGFQVIAQAGKTDPAIFVWAAGNDHGTPCDQGDQNCFLDTTSYTGYRYRATSPNLEGGAVAKLPELQGHNVVVVAVDRGGTIADFSNRCGVAGPWCIAAPGVDVSGAKFGSSPDPLDVLPNLQGTSFAAPMVSGGLALMKHFFRDQLSNRELVTRLFATARKSGIYTADRTDGTSSIYGQGLMDLGAAVAPVDNVQVMMNGRVGGNGHSIQTTHLRLGRAFGDGLSRSLAGREIAAFDALGAPFWFDLSGLAGSAYWPSSMGRLHGLVAPGKNASRPAARGTRMTLAPYALAAHRGAWRIGLYESPVNAESSLLNLAGSAATVTFKAMNGFETTAFATVNQATALNPGGLPRQRTSDVGALLAWRPPDTPVGVRVGWLKEGNSLLGATATGAFGRLSANNVFTGFEAATEVGGWRLAFDTEIGLVAPNAGGGLIDGVSWLTTSAMSLRAHRRLSAQDEMTFSLSQPPRIENGAATFRLPVGRTRDGVILRESFSAGLVPSARQIDLAARWCRTGVFGGEFRAEAAASHNPGHVDAKPMFSLLAGWQAEF